MRLACLCVLLSGCTSLGSARGEPPTEETLLPGYRVWYDGDWHVRAAPGPARHRFQGSVDGMSGGILEVHPTGAVLADHVGRQGNSALFDFEVERGEHGFDVRTTGGCLRFDLWIDGKHRPDHARFGPRALSPSHFPTVACP